MAVDNAAQVDNLVSLLDGYATKGQRKYYLVTIKLIRCFICIDCA